MRTHLTRVYTRYTLLNNTRYNPWKEPMSVTMSVLALLDEGPAYGLQLKTLFEERTAGVWPLNVGQVYQTLARLERDDLVATVPGVGPDGQKTYEITDRGTARLTRWFGRPVKPKAPARDELVLKLVMAIGRQGVDPAGVIQVERKAAVELLQEYTVLKRDVPADGDLGWEFLLDSLIFQAEARVRWLDACEARLARRGTTAASRRAIAQMTRLESKEVPS